MEIERKLQVGLGTLGDRPSVADVRVTGAVGAVEIEFDFDERKESPSNQKLYASPCINYPHTRGRRLKAMGALVCPMTQHALDIDKDGNYTSMLIEPITNYALVKRGG